MISESNRLMAYKDGWEDEELEGAIIIGLPGEEEEPEEEFPSKE